MVSEATLQQWVDEYQPSVREGITRDEFISRYGKDQLANLEPPQLLRTLFGRKDDNSLTYTVEQNLGYYVKAVFGANTTKVLNYSKFRQEGQCWRFKENPVSEESAINAAERIKNKLIEAIGYLDHNPTDYTAISTEFSRLFTFDFSDLFGKDNVSIENENWLQKYFQVLYPDKFMPMSTVDWIDRLFIPLGLDRDEDWYINSGRFAGKAHKFGKDCTEFYHIVVKGLMAEMKVSLEQKGISIASIGNEANILINTPDAWKRFQDRIPEETREPLYHFLAEKHRWTQQPARTRRRSTATVPEADHGPEVVTTEGVTAPQNLIVYGTPGCGKSFYVQNILIRKNNYTDVIRTTFHPEYTYIDFIGQVMPFAENDNTHVRFEFIPGPLAKALLLAKQFPQNRIALVIEEINRGNAAAIFGDIFQLLDRGGDYPIRNEQLERHLKKYGINVENGITLPQNLDIIATMNTGDQNVFTLDTAFKRRWTFLMLENDFNACENPDGTKGHTYRTAHIPGMPHVTWENFVKSINEKILDTGLQAEDKQIGMFFFQKEELLSTEETNGQEKTKRFAFKLFEYLWNDVAKFEREKWFTEDIVSTKTLAHLVSEYCQRGQRVFANGLFTPLPGEQPQTAEITPAAADGVRADEP